MPWDHLSITLLPPHGYLPTPEGGARNDSSRGGLFKSTSPLARKASPRSYPKIHGGQSAGVGLLPLTFCSAPHPQDLVAEGWRRI